MDKKDKGKKINTKLEKLKKNYDDKNISQCIDLAKKFNQQMIEHGEKLVGLLWYLEKTKRYKEYEGYEQLGFDVFISEICYIPYNRYRQIAYAYNWYPKESKEFGPDVIQQVKQAVGVAKTPEILDEIEKKISSIKKPIKRRKIISDIIQKYKPKRYVSNDTKSYWKKEAENWKSKYEKAWDEIRTLQKENNELKEQLMKQRLPIENLGEIRKIVERTVQLM